MSSKKKDSKEKPEYIKMVLLGNRNVGKTSLIYKYINNVFIENTVQTSSEKILAKGLISMEKKMF